MRPHHMLALILALSPAADALAAGEYGAADKPTQPLQFAKTPDYGKRLQALDASLRDKLLGRWTNPVDHVIIEIASVDLASGALRGTEWAQTGPAAGDAHELVGWVSAAPQKEGSDNVLPVSFSTTLYEYGTLPSWAGFYRDGQIVTMHYLIWPNRTYTWDHVSSFQETWTKLP